MSCFHFEGGEAGLVPVGNHHDVAGRIGIGVEADEASFAAEDEASSHFCFVAVSAGGDGVIDGRDEVAENAAEIAGPVLEAAGNAWADGFFCVGDVAIAPGGPEQIHIGEYSARILEDRAGVAAINWAAREARDPQCG